MPENPYKAPNSNSEIARNNQSRRPISVWLLLFLLAFIVTMQIYGFITSNSTAAAAGVISEQSTILMATANVLFILAFVYLTMSVFIAKKWARWAGVLLLLLFLLLALFSSITRPYASAAEGAGAQVGRYIIGPILIIWWIYSYGFSKKAKDYFSR